jgi:membrane-bound metal-dependent hydrolase YbcI (DUF457 family)
MSKAAIARGVDIATHALVPMAGALAALGFYRREAEGDRRRAAIAATFGAAGFAPDMDGGIDWLSNVSDSLYFLQHRGLSHTLVGAPLFALALLGALVLAARWSPARFGLFVWRPVLVPAAILGSFTHLLFDIVTYAGVPLFWPFAYGRVSLFLFHWVVIWILPLAGVVMVLHMMGRMSRRRVVQAGAALVALLVLLAGVRLATRPWDEGEDALIYSRSSELEWTVVKPLPNGSFEAYLYRLGERGEPMWFASDVPPNATAAVEKALATPAFKGFLLGSFGPVVTRAAATPSGGWNVTFTDVAQRFEALHGPQWTPSDEFEEWGYLALVVEDDRVRPLHTGW